MTESDHQQQVNQPDGRDVKSTGGNNFTSLRDRIAAALYLHAGFSLRWDEAATPLRDDFLSEADAVIAQLKGRRMIFKAWLGGLLMGTSAGMFLQMWIENHG